MAINEYRTQVAQGSLQWLNQNMHRNYPIQDDCAVQSQSGKYLPSSFLVDCSIEVPTIENLTDVANRFYISNISTSGASVEITISFAGLNGTSFVCAQVVNIPVTLRAGLPVDDRKFQITAIESNILTEYEQLQYLSGYVTIGTCQDIVDLGTLSFSYQNARLSSSCVHQAQGGLTQVQILNAENQVISNITNDFYIKAGDGISMEVQRYKGYDLLIISRTQTQAQQQAEYKSVQDILQRVQTQLGNPITSINGITSQSGNIQITGTDCLQVKSGSNAIIISNTCSKPCCTDQTSGIEQQLQSLQQARTRLLAYYESLSNNINAMQSRLSSLIASRA